ncbi:IS701 family transposase [Desulfobacca acetoxidans]|uniref:Transposase IS4 family protein n=1 Tax=Desulfobacca acetoxidans (strain ATCC 700848 / DSM 11109 / ASRB2) TaxID=880072 RepID=F2NHB7_DESAR|nr:transposase [Desulfobacca acetoxidans]AEB09033.1 transposase IS4 family protein [Desulfobacca acetoxidans DSM 11109]AEB09269.1 transposase IS4 family protein [Desulfobacca acetoxidans DSM 11109]
MATKLLIPYQVLAQWLTILWQAVPIKLRPTLLELLFGNILSGSGHITDAILTVCAKTSWSNYFKALQSNGFSWLSLCRQWLVLVLRYFPRLTITLVIDDMLTPRTSKKAPSAAIYHDHAHRPNRPPFIFGQLRVALAIVLTYAGRTAAFPWLWRLIRTTGNTSKLKAAQVLMALARQWVPRAIAIRLLLDAWYMKKTLVLRLIHQAVTVIGQVRRDTVCYLLPTQPSSPRRGAPRKYGEKLTFAKAKTLLPLQHASIKAYGKTRRFEFYTAQAKVRFLKGHICRVVWCRFLQDSGKWTNWALLLATDPTLTAANVIKLYSRRWWIEPMFNEIKHSFGLINAWQQSRQTLARWTTLISLSYSLPRLLALWLGDQKGAQLFPIPWRRQQAVTAGWIVKAVQQYFRLVNIRACWDRKSQKFVLPNEDFMATCKKAA